MGTQSSKQFSDGHFRLERLEGVDFLSLSANIWRWNSKKTAAVLAKSSVATEAKVPDYNLFYKMEGVDFLDNLFKKNS